jgi:hypothetical protein
MMPNFPPAAPPVVVTPSERVLLFGDRFSEPGGVLSTTETILSSGIKVKLDPLVHNAVAAALLAAEQSGSLRLEIRQGKAMFGLMSTQAVHMVPGPRAVTWPQGSLESYAGQAAATQPGVANWVSALIGQRQETPQYRIVNVIKHGLATRGVLHAEQKTTLKVFTSVTYSLPPAVRASAEQSGTAHVQEMLARCQHERPQVWNEIVRGIKSGIAWMTESSQRD